MSQIANCIDNFKNIHTFFLLFITLLNEYCLLLESAANKIRRKKGQAVFTCQARSTLEAAVAEIINEIPSCDLSKWTGNKSLLIGPAGGARAVATASWKLQVLAKYCGYQPGGQVRGSRRPEEASGSGEPAFVLPWGL